MSDKDDSMVMAHQDAYDAPRRGATPGGDPLLQFFANQHLPPPLRAVSEPFRKLAEHVVLTLPRNPERTVALRKLLESKDSAVRSMLFKADAC